MRIYFTNLGCKLNQAEVDRMARDFLAAGHRLSPSLEQADLHIVNSCTVTHLAARDSRKVARRGGRLHSELKTVITGCYASDSPEEAAALVGVDLVVPNDRKDQILTLVHQAFPEDEPKNAGLPIPFVPLEFGHSRALVKVEDGCNMRCSFCIIPSTRGRQRSRSVADVVEEVNALACGGYQEVVITGVQISEYEAEGQRLFDLVSALLQQTTIPRLRLTSIAPWKFDDRLLDLWQDPRLCRHIHMSLQSGSTATLRRMRRPYSAPAYADLAQKIREAIPGLALTTDVIVGFPGETEEEFEESLTFVEEMAFARPHIFTYSERSGTHAATLKDDVSPQEKKRRVHAMRSVGEESELRFWRRQLGQEVEVVWEEQRGGTWRGLSDNYIKVWSQVEGSGDLTGRLGRVRLETAQANGVHAVPLV